MFLTPYFSKYRINEIIQFIKNVLSLCKQHGLEKLNIQQAYKFLEEKVQTMEALANSPQGSQLTKDIEKLDVRRDAAWICVDQVSSGFLHHFLEDKKEAGQYIQDALLLLGDNVPRETYQVETAYLKKFIDKFNEDNKLQQAFQLLGITDLVQEIEESNNAFNSTYIERVKETGNKPKSTATEETLPTVAAYRKLCENIKAHYVLTESDDYLKLIKEINVLIKQYNHNL